MNRSQVAFLHLAVDFGNGFDLDFGDGSFIISADNGVEVVVIGDGLGDDGFVELELEVMGSLFSMLLVLVSKNLRRGEHEGVGVLLCFDSSVALQGFLVVFLMLIEGETLSPLHLFLLLLLLLMFVISSPTLLLTLSLTCFTISLAYVVGLLFSSKNLPSLVLDFLDANEEEDEKESLAALAL